jgi:hypothetical protein
MKFAIKSIVAAAAFVAVGAASAATVTVSGTQAYTSTLQGGSYTATGTGALTFSDTLVSALNTGKITVDAVGSVSSIDGVAGAYNAVAVTAPVNALSIDTATDAIVTAFSSGGARQTAANGTAISCKTSAGVVYNCGNGVATGGNVFVGNFTVDLVNKAIYGDVTGTGLALANNITNSKGTVVVAAHGTVTVNQIGIKLFDFTTITGPTTLAGEGTYNTSFTGLSLTTAGFTAISDALGLYSIGKTALQGAAADFGQLDSVVVVKAVPAVPEPSTYALMGLGLVGLSLVARRRAK